MTLTPSSGAQSDHIDVGGPAVQMGDPHDLAFSAVVPIVPASPTRMEMSPDLQNQNHQTGACPQRQRVFDRSVPDCVACYWHHGFGSAASVRSFNFRSTLAWYCAVRHVKWGCFRSDLCLRASCTLA